MEDKNNWVAVMADFFVSDAVSQLVELQVTLAEQVGFPEVKELLTKVLGD